MPDTAAATSQSLYRTLGVYLLVIVAVLALVFVVRVITTRLGRSKEKDGRILITRLTLPLVFLAAFFLLKQFLPGGSRFQTYANAGLIFFAFFFLIRLCDAGIQVWYARARRPFPLPDVLRSLGLGVLYIVVLLAVLKNFMGVNIGPLLTTSAILTMVIGLALQGVLSNILSGMSLHFSRSIHRGEWVAIGAHEGIVVDTNWRETRILDRASNIIVLPNNIVASEKITNFAQPDMRTALIIPFEISAAAPAQSVLDALIDAARDCPQVVHDPPPVAYIRKFDTYGVSYLLKFWLTDYGRKDIIITEVARMAWYKLKRRGIDVAVPVGEALAAFLGGAALGPAAAAGGREAAEARAAAALREENVAILLRSSFLRFQQGEKAGRLMISEDDVQALAAVVQRACYGKGEVLCRQGDKGRSCYVVGRGRIRGEIIYEEGGKKFSSSFMVGPGGIFGEMSLFTGMPRTATGIIDEEADLLKIKAEDFALVLGKNPDLAEVIADLVAARNAQNREFLVKIKELSEKDIEAGTNKKSILDYLKRFLKRDAH